MMGEPAANLECPRCEVALTTRQFSEPQAVFAAYCCPECDGQLLSNVQLRSVEETVQPRLVELRHVPSPEEQQTPLDCPLCSGSVEMQKFHHHRDAKVILDRCPECRSIWLDAGELEAIQEESLPVFFANTVQYFWSLLRS